MANQAHKKKGFQKREPKEFEEEVIQIDRVTRVVKGGRKLRFRATVVIGNKNGKVGVGIGKSVEVTGAIQKAIAKAKKEMMMIKLDDNTIPHETKIKYKAARILLMPAVPGTGLIAGGTIRKVLELAGVKDILSKCYGTTNKVNNTKATFKALSELRETPGMARKAAEKRKKAAAVKVPKTEVAEATETAEAKTPVKEAKKPVVKKSETKSK